MKGAVVNTYVLRIILYKLTQNLSLGGGYVAGGEEKQLCEDHFMQNAGMLIWKSILTLC